MQARLCIGAGLISSLLISKENKAECCGIVGILSEKRNNIAGSLSMGVELLKNRGYDSAGIVTFASEGDNVTTHLLKYAEEANETINCIDKLVQETSKQILRSHIGIGHTRWATCGAKV